MPQPSKVDSHISHPPVSLRGLAIPKVHIPYDHQYIQSLLIKWPKDSDSNLFKGRNYIKLPHRCRWLAPHLKYLKAYLKSIGIGHAWDEHHLYLTVRHGDIYSESASQWHRDGYSVNHPQDVDLMFTWCNREPTEFWVGRFDYPEDLDPRVHNVNWYLEDLWYSGKGDGKEFCQGSVGHWDYYTGTSVHRASLSLSDGWLWPGKPRRTFVRLALIKQEITGSACEQHPFAYKKDIRNRLKRYEF